MRFATADPARELFATSFLGIPMLQQWADLLLWEQFLNTHREVRRLLELGSGRGAMSAFLALQCRQRGIDFKTYDAFRPEILDTPLGNELLVHRYQLGNLWSDLRGVVNWQIQEPEAHPLILFCDGGDKPREFREYGACLQPGDFIFVHDYGTEFNPPDIPTGFPVREIFADECDAMLARTRIYERI